jgi:spermidine synthase
MKPFITLAQARSSTGAELSLHSHDKDFFLRVNGQALMGTNAVESEKMLAQLACQRLRAHKAPRVLIGGLGFGFSLRRVLECVGPGAVVEVAELLPEVVAWNREHLAAVNGSLLDDPRVRIVISDVYQLVAKAPAGYYDAILLDVDNGPIAMTQDGNARLYQPAGLAMLMQALKPCCRATIWSATDDRGFPRRLGKAGFKVDVVAAKAYPQARRAAHTIFVAERPRQG